ncbi:hypothetical protein MA16_Dca027298 [Dendrobium catenatum]|uniref:Uncharacterized protein n=1 Tax=Dendrobium catenatum TaxID=906689 RepID=A0A2I0W2P8_9ASPA|nr:hypothetical protein MA16_Dca027298 [Dendrobium catenatum]
MVESKCARCVPYGMSGSKLWSTLAALRDVGLKAAVRCCWGFDAPGGFKGFNDLLMSIMKIKEEKRRKPSNCAGDSGAKGACVQLPHLHELTGRSMFDHLRPYFLSNLYQASSSIPEKMSDLQKKTHS